MFLSAYLTIRETVIFGNLPICDRFKDLKCGVAIIDLQTKKMTSCLGFKSRVEEVFDVQISNYQQPVVSEPYATTDRDNQIWSLPASAAEIVKMMFINYLTSPKLIEIEDLTGIYYLRWVKFDSLSLISFGNESRAWKYQLVAENRLVEPMDLMKSHYPLECVP
ncbi:MAG: DUF4915 domain-containing protein [Cyanobacteria bacterium J06600_6]